MRCVASWYKYHSSFTTWITLLVAAAAAAVASIVYHKNYKKKLYCCCFTRSCFTRELTICVPICQPPTTTTIFFATQDKRQ
jgi:hypothetical protein